MKKRKHRLDEVMYRLQPAFYLQERPVRSIILTTMQRENVLGYTAEVDTNFLKNHKDEGYQILR